MFLVLNFNAKLEFVMSKTLIYCSPRTFKISGYSSFNQITFNFFYVPYTFHASI